jgi:hypothetical protein
MDVHLSFPGIPSRTFALLVPATRGTAQLTDLMGNLCGILNSIAARFNLKGSETVSLLKRARGQTRVKPAISLRYC